jgi:hypothetical protein
MRRVISYGWDLAAGVVSPAAMFVDEQHSRFWRRMLRLSLLGWAHLSWLTYTLPATPQLDPVRRATAITALCGAAVTLVALGMPVDRGPNNTRRALRALAMLGLGGTLGLGWAAWDIEGDWRLIAQDTAAVAGMAGRYALTIGVALAAVAAITAAADTKLFRHPAALWYGVQTRRRIARRAASRRDPFASR